MTWRMLPYSAIEKFKQQWPCHGLPVLNSIHCEFATNGDLIDIDCRDPDGKELDSSEFDGPALLALVEDVQKHGERSD